MAAGAPDDAAIVDSPAGDASVKSCCQVWMIKYSKTEERRAALKKAVQLLQKGLDDIQAENIRLKKAYDEELARADTEKDNRVCLENEITALNSEISYLKQIGKSDVQDRDEEIMLLQTRVSEGEKEINQLRELYEKEKKRADMEKTKAEANKKKGGRASKSKGNTDEEDRDEEIMLLRTRVSEGEKEINQLRELYEKEKKRADLEKKKAEANKKKAGKASKSKGNAAEEDRDEEIMLLQKRVSEGEKEINKLKKLYEKEKRRADSEKKKAETNRKKAGRASKSKANAADEEGNVSTERKGPEDYMVQLEVLRKEVDELKSKLALEISKFEEASRKLEAEKKNVAEERKRADLEMAKAEEERQVAEANSKKATEEKLRAESLSEQLENYGKRIEELEKMIESNAEKEDRLQESAEMVSLEHKISVLNSEISSLKLKGLLEAQNRDEEIKLLRAQVAEREKEISQLKMLYEEEKERTDSEKKNAQEEKKKSAKASESLQAEKGKAAEERRLANIERKRAGDYMLQLETLKNEVKEAKSQLVSEASKAEELKKELLIEKQKVTEERKRVDMEMAKAKEEKRHAEANRKRATEAKLHADSLSMQLEKARERIQELEKKIRELEKNINSYQLSGQLEEAMIKIAALQKRIQEISQCKKTAEDKGMNAKVEKIKFLKKKLKFEKKQVKHAKDVARLGIGRSTILQQELGHLKVEVVWILRRLDVLAEYFLNPVEETNELQKDGDFANTQKLKEKLHSLNSSQPFLENENLLPFSGGVFTEPTSGIDSKLEPLLGGSKQKVLKCTAIHSSRASFSDRQLVGSQGRGAFSVTTSAQLGEENLNLEQTMVGMSSDVAKNMCNENLAVVAENTVRSVLPIDTVNKENGFGRKRKRVLDAVESIELLCSKGKKLHLQLEDKLSSLHDMLNWKMEKPFEEAKRCGSYLQGDSDVGNDVRAKKMKTSHRMVSKDPTMVREASRSADCLIKDAGQCRGANFDSSTNVNETLLHFEDVVSGDYMKLLDLDNAADEECYRIASEMPLSPTLPEISFQGLELSYAENIKSLNTDGLCEKLSNQKENVASSYSFDVISVEIESNKLKSKEFKDSHDPLNHATEGAFAFTDNLQMSRNGFCGIRPSGSLASHTKNSEYVRKTAAVPGSGDEHRKISSQAEPISTVRSTAIGFVVSPDFMNSSSVSRIFCATKRCATECSLATETELAMPRILVALKGEDIVAKEKACVFFSLLLLKFMALLGEGYFQKDPMACLESFSRHINLGILDAEARNLFSELCSDELLSVMKSFLMDGRVMVYDASSSDSGSKFNTLIDDTNLTLSSEAASIEQLVAGSIILASVCTAVGWTGFVCNVAYNILKNRRYDTSVMLTILHVFAFFGGEKFLDGRKRSLVTVVFKSIIMFLERESTSTEMGCLFSSMSEAKSDSSPFAECPFSKDTLPVDDVTLLLLEKLQKLSESPITHPGVMENALDSCILFQMDKGEASSTNEEPCHFLDMNCDGSYCLLKHRMAVEQSETSINVTLCHITDALSLLELLACSMHWNWTYNRIISRLLRMLELPLQVDYTVAISTLLGHLGRLGVEAVGYEDEGVKHLISQLSAFLWRETTIRTGLSLQIAVITALLELFSLGFEEVIQSNFKLPRVAGQSVPTELIRSWYRSLNEEQQALSTKLFHSRGVVTN